MGDPYVVGTADPWSPIRGATGGDWERAGADVLHRCEIQSRTGDATKIDENVPTMIPNVITRANGLMTSPAKNERKSAVARVVPPVRIVRGNVSLIDRLRIVASERFPRAFRFSRTRSKITIVSFSE